MVDVVCWCDYKKGRVEKGLIRYSKTNWRRDGRSLDINTTCDMKIQVVSTNRPIYERMMGGGRHAGKDGARRRVLAQAQPNGAEM